MILIESGDNFASVTQNNITLCHEKNNIVPYADFKPPRSLTFRNTGLNSRSRA